MLAKYVEKLFTARESARHLMSPNGELFPVYTSQ